MAAIEAIKVDPQLHNNLQEFLPSVLARCVRHGSIDSVRYLLECEAVPIASLSPLTVAANSSIALLELLLAHGWDINKAEADGYLRGHKLIDLVCDNHELVQWLVGHGARVTDGEVDNYELALQPAPLLETCATRGSVATFRFLQSKGALIGQRTLHRAAGEAAAFGTDPFADFKEVQDGAIEDNARKRRERAEMLVFLVDEMKLNINAMDAMIPDRANHWGTPLCYAAVKERGAHVVRWLLEKGAQPTVETVQNVADAEALAQFTGCVENARILREWKRTR
ncbi:hypothetical protein FBEOM_7129 [Fusarium beomiforme]|uniref:Ankyrin repeat protein n=1 Tax=Fusarium beomiforme TaxID=44412 RepID=A0A9P5DYF1_9HYPO|nr:hypothetical protein FBEOM_7129 [Fusarium beomiforme]